MSRWGVKVQTGWLLVLMLGLVTVIFAVGRALDVTNEAPSVAAASSQDPFDRRYNEHPVLTLVHILPGLFFMLLGPLQFLPRIRARWLSLHRWSGRVFILTGLVAAVSSLVITVVFPIIGGLSTAVATYFFAFVFIVCIVKAYLHVRRREIVVHREWMIRAFAIGLGVSTIRLLVPVFELLSDLTFAEYFSITFWLGFSLNLMGAEIWINCTRPRLPETKKGFALGPGLSHLGPFPGEPGQDPTVQNQ